MKRFIFRLEGLELLRRRRREACELGFAQSRARRDRQAEAVAVLALEQEKAQIDWRAALPASGPLDLRELGARRAYLAILVRRIALAERGLVQADREVAGARQTLLEASRHEKAVVRLRERRKASWTEAEGREEQAFLDEVALTGRAAAGSRA